MSTSQVLILLSLVVIANISPVIVRLLLGPSQALVVIDEIGVEVPATIKPYRNAWA